METNIEIEALQKRIEVLETALKDVIRARLSDYLGAPEERIDEYVVLHDFNCAIHWAEEKVGSDDKQGNQ